MSHFICDIPVTIFDSKLNEDHLLVWVKEHRECNQDSIIEACKTDPKLYRTSGYVTDLEHECLTSSFGYHNTPALDGWVLKITVREGRLKFTAHNPTDSTLIGNYGVFEGCVFGGDDFDEVDTVHYKMTNIESDLDFNTFLLLSSDPFDPITFRDVLDNLSKLVGKHHQMPKLDSDYWERLKYNNIHTQFLIFNSPAVREILRAHPHCRVDKVPDYFIGRTLRQAVAFASQSNSKKLFKTAMELLITTTQRTVNIDDSILKLDNAPAVIEKNIYDFERVTERGSNYLKMENCRVNQTIIAMLELSRGLLTHDEMVTCIKYWGSKIQTYSDMTPGNIHYNNIRDFLENFSKPKIKKLLGALVEDDDGARVRNPLMFLGDSARALLFLKQHENVVRRFTGNESIIPSKWKDSRELHDILSDLQQKVNEALSSNQSISYRNNPVIERLIHHRKFNEYTMVLPRSKAELIRWGRELKNCCGGYYDYVKDGKSYVIAFEKNGKAERLMDITPTGTIRQYVGFANSKLDIEPNLEKLLRIDYFRALKTYMHNNPPNLMKNVL